MRQFFSCILALTGILATACGSSPPAGCDVYVLPGGAGDDHAAVQAAIVGLEAGQTLCFGPGTFGFSDELTFSGLDGITVRGTGSAPGDVVLDFAAQTAGAKGMSFTGMDDLTVENLTVLDAPGDNLFVTGSTNLTLRDLVSGWESRPMDARGRYALYPVQSTNVLVENVEAYGSSDAGIYVGQATNCIVRDSLAHDNVAGIEIENSLNCDVLNNVARDNTGGILVFDLPGLPLRGMGTSLRGNTIENNDLTNFAEPGTIVSFLPPGTGIMLLAANVVEIEGNTITGNDTTGALVIGYNTAEAAGAGAPMDAGYDPFTEEVWFHGNTFSDNGRMPTMESDAVALVLGAAGTTTLEDVLWDGDLAEGDTEMTLCIEGDATFRDIDFPGGLGMQSTDIAPHRCMGTARPPVMF
jgi:parallel beta-helix repeat protein